MRLQQLKPSQRVQGRWLAQMEDGTLLRISEHEVIQFSLYEGKELEQEIVEQLQQSAHTSKLKEKALQLLAAKPVSRRDLKQKLISWEAGEGEAEEICQRLEELGLLNDREYGAMLVGHYLRKGYGQGRLKEELYRRGVPRELWDEILEQSEQSDDVLDALIAKKLKGTVPQTPREWKKVSDALLRRGYSWSEVSQALRRYGAEMEESY